MFGDSIGGGRQVMFRDSVTEADKSCLEILSGRQINHV